MIPINKHVSLFTDGSCNPNPGKGGWAAIILDGRHHTEISGTVPHGSNNRMELAAVVNGLARLPPNSSVKVFTDSAYVEKAINEGRLDKWAKNGWKRIRTGEPVKNRDLWMVLSDVIDKKHLTVSFTKVAAHKSSYFNNRADLLARQAAKAGRKHIGLQQFNALMY